MSRIVWSPQPKQAIFQSRPEYEALYGGSAGGGKSDALLAEALRQVNIPHYRAIIFRKTFPQLTELIDRSRELYSAAFPKAKYNGSAHCWTFPSGAKIYFGNMNNVGDRINYQGKRYDFIGFDELTHFTWDEYSYMMSRNRPGGAGTRVYIRASTNPGGIGHGWVKDRFISAAAPLTPIESEYEVAQPDGKIIKMKRSRIFVPATVFDNQKLLSNDPNYLANLAMLPEAEKNALLYGSWDSFDGQVFTEWKNDSSHYEDRRFTHVVKPFEIPPHWLLYRGFDWGYSKPYSVGWYAVSPKGNVYRIRELYGCTGEPNTGVKETAIEIARQIREIEEQDPIFRGHKRSEIIGVADPAIFSQEGGQSIAEQMELPPNFITWDKGDHTRIAGKMQFHYRFAFDADGFPKFQVFENCKHFIRTIPTLCYDAKHVEDIDTAQEDHIYDECRYVLMENPIAPRKNEIRTKPLDDPLNLYHEEKQHVTGSLIGY